MPRKSDAKNKLTHTALELIWSSSYSKISVDDICKEAGVKKGSFYHHFKSKSELAHLALDESWESRLPTLNERFSPEYAPLERLERYLTFAISSQVGYFKEKDQVLGCPYATIGSEQCGGEDDLREKAANFLMKLSCFFESAITEAQARGDLGTALSPQELTRVFMNQYIGALTQARVHNDIERLSNLASLCVTVLVAASREPAES